jgi:arsenate reductase
MTVATGGSPKVLFVCRHNAGRSQMAAAAAQQLDGWQVRSAGVDTERMHHPMATSVVACLLEVGVVLDAGTRRHLLEPEDVEWADVVVMVVEPQRWPDFVPRDGGRTSEVRWWPVDDPRGRDDDVLRATRDHLTVLVGELHHELVVPGAPK